MNARRLNNDGIERFARFLDSLGTDSPQAYPEDLLTDPNATRDVEPSIGVEPRTFNSRLSVAKYFFDLLGDSQIPRLQRDVGLWTWLSLFFFPQICPKDSQGRWKPGERGRWILQNWRNRAYMHLLAGPFCAYYAHRRNPGVLAALLSGPVNRFSDFYLELAKRQEMITNPAIVEAATRLYFDPEARKPKPRISRDTPGGVRRFVEVLSQFDCTWDLYSMTPDDILNLLPPEFERFKPLPRRRSLRSRRSPH